MARTYMYPWVCRKILLTFFFNESKLIDLYINIIDCFHQVYMYFIQLCINFKNYDATVFKIILQFQKMRCISMRWHFKSIQTNKNYKRTILFFCRDLKMENIMLDEKKRNIKLVGMYNLTMLICIIILFISIVHSIG